MCNFQQIFNGCGCLIGYNLPLQDVGNNPITSYPVVVVAVDGTVLQEVSSPSMYAYVWNSYAPNRAYGILHVGTSAYCFYLTPIIGVTPPSNVLGQINTTNNNFRINGIEILINSQNLQIN
jgi:hypothetical protein